jgi:hypothetical protein
LSFLLFGSVSVFSATVKAKGGDQRIIIAIQPTAQSFASAESVRLKVSITNHSRNNIGFSTCPSPYKVEVSDQLGKVIPPKPEVIHDPSVDADGKVTQVVDLPMCVHSFELAIKPGDTWTEEFTLSGLVDLKSPGIYAVQLIWEFPTNVRKIGDRVSFKTLQIPSNRTNITIAE